VDLNKYSNIPAVLVVSLASKWGAKKAFGLVFWRLYKYVTYTYLYIFIYRSTNPFSVLMFGVYLQV
jgi:hypothetical protein